MPTDRPKRVLHVVNSLGISGGAEQQLVANLERFSDPRLEHHLIYLYEYDFETRVAQVGTATQSVTSLYALEEPRARLRTIRRLDKAVRRLGPDLIHCSLADASLASRLVGWRQRIPVMESLVNISHEPVRSQDNPAVKPWKLRAHTHLDRLTMRRIVRFHALSDAVADSWVRTVGLPRERITVVPRGIDIPAIRAVAAEGPSRDETLEELHLAHDTKILLSVGRLEPQKGQSYLIEAMPSILKSHSETVLLIVGRPGVSEPALLSLVTSLGLGDVVRFLGRRTDVPSLVSASDLFVFPSLYEGLGVSLLEAMALGASVAASDVAPMNQVVSDGVNGRLFKPATPTEIARVVAEELRSTSEDQSTLRAAATETIAGGFALSQTAADIEALYLDILAPG